MHSKQHLQSLYAASSASQYLWYGNSIQGLNQFHLDVMPNSKFSRRITKRIRLGQLVEQFVFNQLETNETVSLVAENIQITKDKQTIGELDAIVCNNGEYVHLEIVYKFYIYDPKVGSEELEHWIGPNRKDSLLEKLSKLKRKQFPLLHTDACRSVLKSLNINSSQLKQETIFKAQLFVPFEHDVIFEKLNAKCVSGFYINESQMHHFNDCQFYIPSKHDWLLNPSDHVLWMDLIAFKKAIKHFTAQQQSPLFWLKHKDLRLQKAFVVWW